MYTETWFVKRTSESKPEMIVLFFENRIYADACHYRAVRDKDARKMFGSDFPKEIASAWQ